MTQAPNAWRFGAIKELAKGELASRQQSVEYDAIQAGCADLMRQRAALKAALNEKA
jgi:hypothetical protein